MAHGLFSGHGGVILPSSPGAETRGRRTTGRLFRAVCSDHPLATSFLLALIAVPLFYPGAPAAVLRIAILPSFVSVIRLLPGLLPRTFRHWVFMLVAIMCCFFGYLLPPDWLLTRVLLLMIAAGGCVGLGWFLRSRGAELSASGTRERLILMAARLGLFLFAVSVVSNFAGNMTLAEFSLRRRSASLTPLH